MNCSDACASIREKDNNSAWHREKIAETKAFKTVNLWPHIKCPSDCMFLANYSGEKGCNFSINKVGNPKLELRGCEAGKNCIRYVPTSLKLTLTDEIIALLRQVASGKMSARKMYNYLGCSQSVYERLKKEAVSSGLVVFTHNQIHNRKKWEGENLELLKKVQQGELTPYELKKRTGIDEKTTKNGLLRLELGEFE